MEKRDPAYPSRLTENLQIWKQLLIEEKNSLKCTGRSLGQIFGILFNKEFVINGSKFILRASKNQQLINEIFPEYNKK